MEEDIQSHVKNQQQLQLLRFFMWTTYGQSTHHHYHLNLIQHTFHPFIPRGKTMLFLLNWFILVKAVIELLFPDGSN